LIVSLIAAMAENRAIGLDGALPWRLPRDMRHFKELTTGHTVIMGRKTYDTLPRPLPNRRNIVITRDRSYQATGADVFHNLSNALLAASEDGEVFVAGGAQVYALALPSADRIHLTVVHAVLQGDTFFPEFAMSDWRLQEDIRYDSDEKHLHSYSFRLYERRAIEIG
jgi:dihydrofolate reductase